MLQMRILQEKIAASSKYGDSVSSHNVSRDYFKIKNIMAYLDIPHYVMLDIYRVAEKAFGECDDPIAEFLKHFGFKSIVDLGCAPRKELLRLNRKFCAEQNVNGQEGVKKSRKALTKTEQNHSQCKTESDAADDYDFSRCSFSRISKLITSLTNWAKDETKMVGNDWNEYKLRELNALKYALINLSKAVTNNLDVNHSTKAA